MISLLRSELYSIRKTAAVRLTFIIMALTSVIFGIQQTSPADIQEYKDAGWNDMLYFGGNLCSGMNDAATIFTAALLAAWIISQSFENRSIQEAVCYGKSRTKVYITKMFIFLLSATITGIVYWVGGSIPMYLENGMGTEEVSGNLCHPSYVAGMLISGCLAYISIYAICGVTAFIARKTSIAMGICIIVISFGFKIILQVLPGSIAELAKYTPVALYSQVLKTDVTWDEITKTGIISLIWIFIICAAGLWKFKKAELK